MGSVREPIRTERGQHQIIKEIFANSGAGVDKADPFRQIAGLQDLDHCRAKTVITQQYVTAPKNSHRRRDGIIIFFVRDVHSVTTMASIAVVMQDQNAGRDVFLVDSDKERMVPAIHQQRYRGGWTLWQEQKCTG